MAKITVHSFKVFHAMKGEYVEAGYKATREWIARAGGEVIPDSEEEIDDICLDGTGRYFPANKEGTD
ncbi:hypothetical protein [Aestuariivirga sp.]|uniref:hypothetical protein n=1 Tax=Aestuariivirga sp. TaxID=2650926 RepID=UPI00391D11B3